MIVSENEDIGNYAIRRVTVDSPELMEALRDAKKSFGNIYKDLEVDVNWKTGLVTFTYSNGRAFR